MAETIKLKPEEYSEARIEIMKENGTWVEPKKTTEVVEIKKEIIPKVTKKKEIQITIQDSLIKDIVKLYKKYYERAKIETIMYYWEMGKRVNQEYGKPNMNPKIHIKKYKGREKDGSYNKLKDSYISLVKMLREQGIKITTFDLRQSRRFAVKYPQIGELIKQENISWNKIRRGLVDKKEIEDKAHFNKLVIKNFQKWNGLVNEFYNAIPKIDFSDATNEDKGECIKILKNTVKKLNKRVEELENGKL